MEEIVRLIREDLVNAVDPKTKDGYKRYFKEEVKFYGLKSAALHSIARKHLPALKVMNKNQLYATCEELLSSGYGEEAILVGLWLPKFKKLFEREDITVFRDWIDKYIDNWAECDTFCNHTLGDFLEKFPESIHEIKTWTASANRWMQRAAAVSLILPARRGKYLSDIFEIADSLLLSEDDMVQKGYGWMLKEASKAHRQEVFKFVVDRKAVMPRTALRYAIEKMPEGMRREAMRR